MSRIEQAIEKAVGLRGGKRAAPAAARAHNGREAADFSAYEQAEAVHVRSGNPYMVTLNEPGSPVSEEYKKLKSMIVRLTRAEKFLNTLMVTSTVGGEGKSITSLNLAITLAQEYDHTVLLVDADIRKPSIHKYLNLDAGRGLTECLRKEAEIKDVLVKTDIGRLTVLPAGSKVENPVELLSSQKMKSLVEELKNRYPERYIIIDTPPLLPFAETRSLSSMVDGIIFVVREGAAKTQAVTDAVGLLKGSNVLGVVYNGAESENLKGQYAYYEY